MGVDEERKMVDSPINSAKHEIAHTRNGEREEQPGRREKSARKKTVNFGRIARRVYILQADTTT